MLQLVALQFARVYEKKFIAGGVVCKSFSVVVAEPQNHDCATMVGLKPGRLASILQAVAAPRTSSNTLRGFQFM